MKTPLLTFAIFLTALILHGAAYELNDGTTASGEPFSYNATGLVLQTPSGLSERIPWTNFSPQSLRALQEQTKDPNKAVHIENFFKSQIQTNAPAPEPPRSKLDSLPRPIAIGLLILAFAIALFILQALVKALLGKTRRKPDRPKPIPAPLLPVEPATYTKPDYMFHRRFFEKHLPAFIRLAIEGEHPKTVIIKSARGTFVGKRITRLTDNELHLQTFKGFATANEVIPYIEITEVQVAPGEKELKD